jgi:hypothetical protein
VGTAGARRAVAVLAEKSSPGPLRARNRSRYDAASGSSPPEAANFFGLTVMFGVHLRRVAVMLMRMQRVPVRRMGVMRCLLVVARLGMCRRLAMMLRRMLVMLGGFLVMLVNTVTAHRSLPCCQFR